MSTISKETNTSMEPMIIALTGAGIPTFQDIPGIKEKTFREIS